MSLTLLREDWLRSEKQLLVNLESTYSEFFADTLEADVDSFEGIELPAEPVLVEDIVTSSAGSLMYWEFIESLGNEMAYIRKELCENVEDEIILADALMEELNEALSSCGFFKEWLDEHKGINCYVSYWEGGIGLMMNVSL